MTLGGLILLIRSNPEFEGLFLVAGFPCLKSQ